MHKTILVIGGTYFIGRIFARLAARTGNYLLHTVNRGRYPLKDDGITQITCDRHDTETLARLLRGKEWDAVVDFCAYEPGDISSLLQTIPGRTGQYIYISTCSVYAPGGVYPKSEASPHLEGGGGDPGLEYAFKKSVLEKEAVPACTAKGAHLTILRPAFVYGPLNYAPREAYYFDRLLRREPIPVPLDATGRFQFVYVKDIARAIMACIANPAAYDEDFILSAPDRLDYASYLDVLASVHGRRPETVPVTVRQVYDENIPLPFPLDSDELYDGTKAEKELGIEYTPFIEGIRESYDVYMSVHGSQGEDKRRNSDG